MPGAEQSRDQARMPGAAIPRPSSQPKSFPSAPPPRPLDVGRPPQGPPQGDIYGRRDEEYNPERPPVRVLKYEEPRYLSERERQEREFQQRERERRERAISGGGDPASHHPVHQAEYSQQMGQRAQPAPYNRQPDPRDRGGWPRQQVYEPSRAPYDPAASFPRQHHDYPTTTAPSYGGHPTYSQPPVERHPPSSHPGQHAVAAHSGQAPSQPYESPERQRLNALQHVREQPPPSHRPRPLDEGPVPPPSVAYGTAGTPALYEPPRNRSMDEVAQPPHHQRTLLHIQEINRRGRISPLPQAVQGAQPQMSGPAGEPGIKSEFGRMFSGIGSGVGAISSPVPAGAQLPYAPSGLARREDSEAALQDSGADAQAKNRRDPVRGKRRKLKDEDGRDDEDVSGRLSPSARVKRSKPHAHHHQYVTPDYGQVHQLTIPSHHHHHHHHHGQESASSPSHAGNTPFKNVKSSAPVPSPTGPFAKDFPTTHHHHIAPRSTPQAVNAHMHGANPRSIAGPQQSPRPTIFPKPKQIISSKAVLDSVAGLPRHHLGDVLYEPILKPARLHDPRTGRPPRHAYSSTPKPLPWDLIEDKLNCTLTVKVGKQHLVPSAREEITNRRAIWGTEIYTDDSDVVAACIHGGWIRGEWPDDVDLDALGLDEGPDSPDAKEAKSRKSAGAKQPNGSSAQQHTSPDVLTEPPKTGPVAVPENRDLHVTLLILPVLEKYASTVRFGIKSREFGGRLGGGGGGGGDDDDGPQQRAVHDGLSFMVRGIRWVSNGAGTQNRLRGKARRERIRRALREVELGPSWGGSVANIYKNGAAAAAAAAVAADKQPAADVAGGIRWKLADKPPSEADKENQPVADDGDGRGDGPGVPTPGKELEAEEEMALDQPEAAGGEKMAVDQPEGGGEEKEPVDGKEEVGGNGTVSGMAETGTEEVHPPLLLESTEG